MGWTYTHKDRNVSPVEFVKKNLFTYEEQANVLAASKVGGAVYVAYKVPPHKITERMRQHYDVKNDHLVIALIIAVRGAKDYYNFGYKDMDESSLPYYFDAPAKILNLLTPFNPKTDPDHYRYAKEWRDTCREKKVKVAAKPKLANGMHIKLVAPLDFGKWGKLDEFTVRVLPGRKRARTLFERNGMLFRVPGRYLENVTVVGG